jgi:hypothetical protein
VQVQVSLVYVSGGYGWQCRLIAGAGADPAAAGSTAAGAFDITVVVLFDWLVPLYLYGVLCIEEVAGCVAAACRLH